MPETSAMWIDVMRHLAESGYRCVAPDQRGYSPGARPLEIAEYSHSKLAADVLNIASAAGFGRFNLVAHDWGAAIGWAAVDIDTDARIVSYTALSIPHYRGFAEATRDDPSVESYRKILAQFLNPDSGIVERWSANDFGALRSIWGGHDDALAEQYLSVFRQDGALDAALNWYRATNGHMSVLDGSSLAFGPVSIPTMVIWGNRDPAVSRMAVDIGRTHIAGPHEFVELEAGHWLVQEEPDIVRTLIERQLARHPAR
jgi:pimeloyl-ACP methyl ester carboxylesterase